MPKVVKVKKPKEVEQKEVKPPKRPRGRPRKDAVWPPPDYVEGAKEEVPGTLIPPVNEVVYERGRPEVESVRAVLESVKTAREVSKAEVRKLTKDKPESRVFLCLQDVSLNIGGRIYKAKVAERFAVDLRDIKELSSRGIISTKNF